MRVKVKHNNYINEIKLKSLCIRVKNRSLNCGSTGLNSRINQLSELYVKLLNGSYSDLKMNQKRIRLKERLKDRIISMSEITKADDECYNLFAKSILTMIKHILTKPQFSSYTYKDEFYSDATFKVVKYIYNFDHTKTSKITGKPVNAFSYITQIIHNSIIYVINEHNKNLSRALKIYQGCYDFYPKYENYYDTESKMTTSNEPVHRARYIRNADSLEDEIRYLTEYDTTGNIYMNYFLADNIFAAAQTRLKALCDSKNIPCTVEKLND